MIENLIKRKVFIQEHSYSVHVVLECLYFSSIIPMTFSLFNWQILYQFITIIILNMICLFICRFVKSHAILVRYSMKNKILPPLAKFNSVSVGSECVFRVFWFRQKFVMCRWSESCLMIFSFLILTQCNQKVFNVFVAKFMPRDLNSFNSTWNKGI